MPNAVVVVRELDENGTPKWRATKALEMTGNCAIDHVERQTLLDLEVIGAAETNDLPTDGTPFIDRVRERWERADPNHRDKYYVVTRTAPPHKEAWLNKGKMKRKRANEAAA